MLTLTIAGCGVLDSFSGRVESVDASYSDAISQNIFTNVIRSGFNEPTNFVAVGKFTGQQTASLTLGLPSLTFGPAKGAAQRQFTFGSNSTTDSAQAVIEISPLETMEFAADFVAPIKRSELGSFIGQGIPAELALYLFVDNIRIYLGADRQEVVVRNDPALDRGQSCLEETQDFPFDPLNSPYLKNFFQPGSCEFHKFQFLLQTGLRFGLRVESLSMANAAAAPKAPGNTKNSAGTSADASKPTAPASPDRFCFDAAQASPVAIAKVRAGAQNRICGVTPASGQKPEELEFLLDDPDRLGQAYTLRVAVQLRSPQSVFRFLGRIARLDADGRIQLKTVSDRLNRDPYLFTVFHGSRQGCFVTFSRSDGKYCLPDEAETSKLVLGVLIRLIQLRTNRQDVPSSPLLLGL